MFKNIFKFGVAGIVGMSIGMRRMITGKLDEPEGAMGGGFIKNVITLRPGNF